MAGSECCVLKIKIVVVQKDPYAKFWPALDRQELWHDMTQARFDSAHARVDLISLPLNEFALSQYDFPCCNCN